MGSIQRQLNLYGFRSTNRIGEKGVFMHNNFVRGDYDAARRIRRRRTWPTKRRRRSNENDRAESVSPTSPVSVVDTSPPVASEVEADELQDNSEFRFTSLFDELVNDFSFDDVNLLAEELDRAEEQMKTVENDGTELDSLIDYCLEILDS
jgi:hypothetical protein